MFFCTSIFCQKKVADSVYFNIQFKINAIFKNQKTNDSFKKRDLAISKFEKELIKSKDTLKLLHFYNYLMFNYCAYLDYESPKKYLIKVEKILGKYKSDKGLGLYFYIKGLLSNSLFSDEEFNFYKKSDELLSNEGLFLDKLLPKFQILKYQSYNQDYKASLITAKEIQNLKYSPENQLSTEFNRRLKEYNQYLDFYFFTAYLHLNKIDSARFYKQKLITSEFKKFSVKHIIQRFYTNEAEFYLRLKKYDSAKLSMEKADSLSKEIFVVERQKLIKVTSNNLKLKDNEINNNINIAKLNETKKNQQISILIIVMLFLVLLFMIIYLYTKSKNQKLLEQNNRKLSYLNRDLEESINAKNTFIDTISHEIKTPINTINSLCYLADQNEKQSSEFYNTLRFSSTYLLNLLNNFVDYNTNQKTANILNLNVVNLPKLIKDIFNFYMLKGQNNNQYILNLDEKINFKVLIDELKLTQIITNLFNNSSKFTANGTILLNTKLLDLNNQKAKILFEIIDNGVGVEESKIQEIFEPFKQENPNVNYMYGGFGLGLSIVKNYIELFGSSVNIESKKGEGTKISFVLDLQIYTDNKVNNLQTDREIKILLVEDNKINQLLTQKIITKKGYQCDTADDGYQAIELVKTNHYSLIFMDIMMPGIDGFETTKKISKINNLIPIIALSSINENLNIDKIKEAHFKYFLNKPTNPEMIYETIDKSCNNTF